MSNFNPGELEISPGELMQMMAAGPDGNCLLLDVREHYELGRGILPGAVVIPMSQLEARWEELPRDRDIVCYCEHGVRSLHVTVFMQQQGLRMRSLAGGFADWNGPTTPSDPAAVQ